MEETYNAKASKRLGEVDYLRAFAIFVMIVGHVGFGGLFSKWIHGFHMPLWFFVSGYFINTKKTTKDYIEKRIKTLLIPYICFSLLYEIIWTIMGNNQWLGLIFPNRIEVPINGSLWFLPALFFADIIAFCVLKYVINPISYFILAILASVSCFVLYNLKIPLSINSALIGIGFILAGYLLKKYAERLFSLNAFIAVFIILAFSVLILINDKVNVRKLEFGNILLFWINAIGMIIGLWNIARVIFNKIYSSVILEIGSESILYVCANQAFIYLFQGLIKKIKNVYIVLLSNAFLVVIIIISCYFLNKLIRKSKIRFLVGK